MQGSDWLVCYEGQLRYLPLLTDISPLYHHGEYTVWGMQYFTELRYWQKTGLLYCTCMYNAMLLHNMHVHCHAYYTTCMYNVTTYMYMYNAIMTCHIVIRSFIFTGDQLLFLQVKALTRYYLYVHCTPLIYLPPHTARILDTAPSTLSHPPLLTAGIGLRPSSLYRPKFNSQEVRHSGTLSSRQTGRNHRNVSLVCFSS